MLYAEREVLKPWCVVVVDDSPEDRAEIRRMLLKGSDRRLSFMEGETAEAGIQAVMDALPPPDCIVLDYNLPDMDAPEVLAALVGPDGMPVCPVVVITGGTNREHGRRALRAGAQDYIGKDWTSPDALTRAVENACEIWAMARELRQREDALRLVADRETFRSEFGSATRNLRDESAVKRVASRLLGLYLKANRVLYGEVVGEATLVVGQSYVNGVQQIESSYNLDDYGPRHLLAALKSGQDIVVSDMPGDCAYSEAEKAAYAQMDICANLAIPILKNGKLAAVLGIHQKTPREWTPEDLLIAREIAERTWAAVEHARADMSLLAKEVQLSQMIQIMPSFSAVLVGPTFVFQLANHAYFDIVGRGPEIIGQTILDVFPEIAGQPFPALLEEVYRTGKTFEAKSMPASLRRGPGRSLVDIFVDFAYLPLRGPDGQVSGIFIHGVDRTAEVRVTQQLAGRERELQDNNIELEAAIAIADKANQAKSEFLSSMSHELRTPLNAILGFGQLLEAGKPRLTDSQQARMEHILKSGWYLLELVDQILDLSVIESGSMPVALGPVDIAAVLLECHAMIDLQAHNSDITLRCPTFDRPVWVQADPQHLKQVLINLLSNAIKYNRAGGSIEVTYSHGASARVHISVRDTGDGLSAEKLAQLFQPFNRLGREAGTIKGTGIGLVVSKRLIELMSGTIGADSTVGTGSVFWIALPAAQAPPADAAEVSADAAATPSAPAGVPTRALLYVEDDQASQELIQDLMARRTDIRLLTATDATSGIALARAHQPDLILMDLNLPSMSGWEALRVLQQDSATRHIRVLALTANAMAGDIERGLAAGFFRYVTKPIQINAFMQVVDSALEQP